jgi:hypothetical protein
MEGLYDVSYFVKCQPHEVRLARETKQGATPIVNFGWHIINKMSDSMFSTTRPYIKRNRSSRKEKTFVLINQVTANYYMRRTGFDSYISSLQNIN